MVPIDSEHDIQSDTPGAIPRGVLSQGGGDVRDAHSEVHPHRRIEALSSVCTRTSLGESRVLLLAILPPPVIAQFPQVKLRLPEPDVNGRFDWRNDLWASNKRTRGRSSRPGVRSSASMAAIGKTSLSMRWTPGAALYERT